MKSRHPDLENYLLAHPPKKPGDYERIAKIFRVSIDLVRYYCRKLNLPNIRITKQSKRIFLGDFDKIAKEIDRMVPKLSQPLRLTGDFVITSDWHIPTINLDWFEIMIKKAKEYNVRNLLVAGDLINYDALSTYWEEKPDQRTPKLSEELQLAISLLDKVDKWFKKVVILTGNHERKRIYRVLNQGIDASFILKILDRFKNPNYLISSQSFCYLDDIRITHPKSFRQTKLSVANVLSAKFNCPVLQAHGHAFSLGYSLSGYLIGDTGCLADWERIQYMWEGDTTHPLWNNGFFIYKDKKIIPIGERIGT